MMTTTEVISRRIMIMLSKKSWDTGGILAVSCWSIDSTFFYTTYKKKLVTANNQTAKPYTLLEWLSNSEKRSFKLTEPAVKAVEQEMKMMAKNKNSTSARNLRTATSPLTLQKNCAIFPPTFRWRL